MIAVPVLLAVLALTLVRPAPASADSNVVAANYGPIVRTALASLSQQRGECFPWVKTVVQAAVNRTIGYDYNLGYLQAGGVEVPLMTARDGDIIQIANPAITVANADYPGLHTAIVIDNLGSGVFRVIDSNSNYDGIVRVRDQYKPAELVARYPGLVVRVYRFTDAAGNPNPVPPGQTPPVQAPPVVTTPTFGATGTLPAVGARVTIAADGDCLRMRSTGGLGGSVVGCLPTGSTVTVTQLGTSSDGYRWVQVSSGAQTGWVAAEYLAPGSGSVAASGYTPPPAAPAAAPVVVTPPRGAFAAPPVFGATNGQASVVFLGGTADQLITASTDARATGVWVQDADGGFQLLIVGGPSFMADAFRARFAVPFGGPVAVTLIGSAT